MKKIQLIINLSFCLLLIPGILCASGPKRKKKVQTDREYWVDVMVRVAHPVLDALSRESLRAEMPIETPKNPYGHREEVVHLEAVGRLLAGMAPWLELGPDETPEGQLRAKYIKMTVKGLENAVNPKSPDFLNFTKQAQPLVDAAFLAEALLRAPNQLWGNLSEDGKRNMIEALRSTRKTAPFYNNWLLFSATIEAALLEFTGEYDLMRVDYAVRKHMDWYKGDGMYGDGPDFHWDYYNSFVIQPMLVDILTVMKNHKTRLAGLYEKVLNREIRYAAIQERMISPEGTYPVIGRSIVYRYGALQSLAQTSLMGKYPKGVTPGQVRSAMTAVIRRMTEAPGTFDEKGWMTIGFCGHQPEMGEKYISTGSTYLCAMGLLPLGLPAEDPFWSDPASPWTSKKAWSGVDIGTDKALYEK